MQRVRSKACGADGRTVYVTQVDGGFVEQFTTDRRGRETCAQGGC